MTSEPVLTFVDMPEVGELSSDGKCFDSKGESPFTVYTKQMFSASEGVRINVTALREKGTTMWIGLLPGEKNTAWGRHRLGSSSLPDAVACCLDDTTVRLFHGGRELWSVPYSDLGGIARVEVHLQRGGKVSFNVDGNDMKDCAVTMSEPLRFAASMKGQGTCVLDHEGLFLDSTELFRLVVGGKGNKRQGECVKLLSLGVLRGNLTAEEALMALWLYDPDSDEEEEEEDGEETTVGGGATRTPLEEQIHQLRRVIRQQVRALRQAANRAGKEAQLTERAQAAAEVQQAERRHAAADQSVKAQRKSLRENQERLAELLSQQAMDAVHHTTTITHDSQRHRQNTL